MKPSPPARPWVRIIVRGLLILVILLAAAGLLYENISEARDRRSNPMPGQLVDVGGYKMHIDCLGRGSPTVVLDSGLGGGYADWYKVQPQIAQFVSVCSYDRAGIGYSESSPRPRTSKIIAEELHSLLHNAGVSGPIVIVGHSLGGFDVRLYAGLYRDEVAGMVLVDASHPDQEHRFPQALKDSDAGFLREFEFMEFAMPFGVPRLLGFCKAYDAIRGDECNFHSLRAGVAEWKAFSESAAQTAATGPLGDMPLAVLSHDPDGPPDPDLTADLQKPVNDAFEQMQEELARLSTRGTRTIARNSSHYIQVDRPDLVIEAVRKVVDQARQPQSAMEARH